ncbi:hypothetical protein BDV24DRAFT_131852 [Aspergillus arachidicola]|uniref:Uncharacterized protein n=1 Tax=Aspergillus arachidicola TaxID=656916 RepID=A0A5N6YB72_9EURO|nr:hypothetical protein BDV24DRAFT_131852 [Aspergillus arachidicola]
MMCSVPRPFQYYLMRSHQSMEGRTVRIGCWMRWVSLEVEELVPDGTTQTWTSRTGKQTKAIQHEVDLNWEVLNGRW